jgi:hypothetical protein
MNLFGESMNLFEIGGRVEGLESLLESYFGPVGYYNDDSKGSNEIPEANPRLAGLSNKKMNDIRDKVCLLIYIFHLFLFFIMFLVVCNCQVF